MRRIIIVEINYRSQTDEKLKTASRKDKMKLLTLFPQNWAKIVSIRTFGVSDHKMWRSQELKKERGIFIDLHQKEDKKGLASHVTKKIIQLYKLGKYLDVCPAAKEFGTIMKTWVKTAKTAIACECVWMFCSMQKDVISRSNRLFRVLWLATEKCAPVHDSGIHSHASISNT